MPSIGKHTPRDGRGFGLAPAALLLPIPRWSERCLVSFCGICRKNKESTSGLEPLTCSLRVITQALQGCAGMCNPPYLKGFLCPVLPCVAPYCVPGGVRVVSNTVAPRTCEKTSPSQLTDELVTPGPDDENDHSLAHAQDLDTFSVLNRHAAVGDAGIAPDRHMNRGRRIGSAEL